MREILISSAVCVACLLVALISQLVAPSTVVAAAPSALEAPAAAGVIHSDFERGFIAAETIAFNDLVTLGSQAKAREAGKLRIEGKEYVVQDGDVIEFRFNV